MIGRMRRFATAFIVVWALVLLAGPRAWAFTCEYVKQEDQGNPDPVTPGGTYNDTSGCDQRVETWNSTGTQSSGEVWVRECDSDLFDSDSVQDNRTAKGGLKQTWTWDGPPGTAPGCTFDVNYSGDGGVACTGVVEGPTASASGSGTAQGTASHPLESAEGGSVSFSAEDQGVGGTVTVASGSSLKGSAKADPTGITGLAAEIDTGADKSEALTFSRTASFTFNMMGRDGSTDGATFCVATFHKSMVSFACTANGHPLNWAKASIDCDVDARVEAEVINIVKDE